MPGKGLTRNVAIKRQNDLRAFRWGMATFHPDVTYLHPTLSCANNAGESGRMLMSNPSCPHRIARDSDPCL